MNNRPFIEHTLVKDRPGTQEVRHLVIHPLDPPSVMRLTQLITGIETPLATGTEYEMREKAHAVMREWITEGFERRSDRDPVFEPLQHVVRLAQILGYRVVYDSRAAKRTVLGQVPLAQWPGITPKLGGGYEYAFEGTSMIARPTLPRNHGLNMSPQTPEETVKVMKAAMELQDKVGPTVTFGLG
jgi:hypothetical protein